MKKHIGTIAVVMLVLAICAAGAHALLNPTGMVFTIGPPAVDVYDVGDYTVDGNGKVNGYTWAAVGTQNDHVFTVTAGVFSSTTTSTTFWYDGTDFWLQEGPTAPAQKSGLDDDNWSGADFPIRT